jgi:hypothetical protein
MEIVWLAEQGAGWANPARAACHRPCGKGPTSYRRLINSPCIQNEHYSPRTNHCRPEERGWVNILFPF